MSGVIIGDSPHWFQKIAKRLLVLSVFQWWSIPLRAPYRELFGEAIFEEIHFGGRFEGAFMTYMELFIAAAISLITCGLTYQGTFPLADTSWKPFERLHLGMLFCMEVYRAIEHDR